MTPNPDSERWERLTAYLTTTMEDQKASRRIRQQAAMRLADLLEAKAKAEVAEAARQERRERALDVQRGKDAALAKVEPATEEPIDLEDRRIQGVFAEILKRGERAA